MCDLVYVLWLDRVERDVLARLSSGRFEVEPEEVCAAFDEWLMSEPEVVDPDLVDLNRALGVGRWRR